MELSGELFEQIVTSLAAGAATTLPNVATTAATQEQRRGPRLSPDGVARVRLIPLTDSIAPGPIDVRVQDVSPGGVRFIHPTRVSLDERFVLLLPSEEGEIAVLCGVAYWQPLAKDLFAIGAKFTRVLRQGSAQSRLAVPPGALPARKAV
jgi:hypothetical protein